MKILMVCLGNICRSPMAEGLMREKITKYNLEAEVDSAGFEAFHTGEPPDARAIRTLKNHGIDISKQRARLFRRQDFDDFDKIYVMDHSNMLDVKSLARTKSDLAKVDFIMNTAYPGSNQPVPDPYYDGVSGFTTVFEMLDKATEAIARKLMAVKVNRQQA